MKTEKNIAEENIKEIKEELELGGKHESHEYGTNPNLHRYEGQAEEHKASCERFLEFFEQLRFDKTWDVCWSQEDGVNIKDKITDLKQAIKLYDEAGI